MEDQFKLGEAIKILSFAPQVTKKHLSGDTFSIWNTAEKAFGITFSSDITPRIPKTHRCMDIAHNELSGEVYFIFGKRGDIALSEAGGSIKDPDKSKNLVMKRRDVMNKLTPLLKLDFSDPKVKQHHIFWLNFLKMTDTGEVIWVVKEKLT